MQRKISVVGLGYVGLPVAVAFAKKYSVVGFDISENRICSLKKGHDTTCEVSDGELQEVNLLYTNNVNDLAKADFHIIAVPTPIDDSCKPDLGPLLSASKMVGKILKKGDIVVYESTVYPGATEEDCIPVLEKESGLKSGEDFFVGYSPERINPGDKEHSFINIKKVVSAQDKETLKIVSDVYSSVVIAGIFEATSIKVAEAAKIIENSQRDINIAFVNELSHIFRLMNINTFDVLEAASSKWNFLPFKPGLVGGHCIGVDPYYLAHKAQKLGYNPEIILAGRRLNDEMGHYVAEITVKEMIKHNVFFPGVEVAILGFSFKENCPDIRNTKVIDIVQELKLYGVSSVVIDPVVDCSEVAQEYGINVLARKELSEYKTVIVAVAHDAFKSDMLQQELIEKLVVIDVKNIVKKPDKVSL